MSVGQSHTVVASFETRRVLMFFRNIVWRKGVRALAVVDADRLDPHKRLAWFALDVQQRECRVLHHAPAEREPPWPLVGLSDVLVLYATARKHRAAT